MNAIAKVFEGEPRTDITVAGGRTTISVALRHLRPFDAQSADDMASLLAVAAVGVAGWISYEAMTVTAPAIGFFLGGLCGRPFMQQKIRHVAQVTATVKFTENAIWLKKIKKAPSWEPEQDWQKFDRSHEHRFVLYQHDKAQAEKDEIDHQIRTKPGLRVARYYGESYYVVLEYLGQRFDVAEVMGQRRANAILDRLTFCDKYMDSLVDVRKGLSMQPEDDWAGPSGSVPQ